LEFVYPSSALEFEKFYHRNHSEKKASGGKYYFAGYLQGATEVEPRTY